MMKIIESPREGMQGFSRIIPTEEKVRFINQLFRVGFDTVETGSIVSPRLIPQMADSDDVLQQIFFKDSISNRMALSVHVRGAEKLAEIDAVTHISYPFSFSQAFLGLNVNSTVEKSLESAGQVVEICRRSHKKAVIYISMAFGNPYGDPWNIELLCEWVEKLYHAGARIIPLSNVSMEIDASLISEVYATLIPRFPGVEFGLHLHTANHDWFEKVNAAWEAGCRRFDGVIDGWGGCPMAGKEMLGNLRTQNLLAFASRKNIPVHIDLKAFEKACKVAGEVFGMGEPEIFNN